MNQMNTARVGVDVHPVDEILPAQKLFALGFQHVLLMYAGAITIPIIIGRAAGLSQAEIAILISADLFASGIVSIIQSLGIWRIGARLPIMMGVTFAAVPSMAALAATPELGMRGIFGAVIGAGLVVVLLAPTIGKLIRFFPPVVIGSVILITGLSLMPTALHWSAGGLPAFTPDYGSIKYLSVSGLVVLVTLLISKFASGFLANIGVLLGLGAGYLLALAYGDVTFGGVSDANWFGVVLPFHFGWPIFNASAIIGMTIVMIVVMVETAGVLLAVGQMVDRPVDDKIMTAGLRADGVGTVIGGIFNTFPYISYTTNIGLLNTTGVKSRWVCVAGGGILIVLGFLPKFSAVATSIPVYVMGGGLVVIFAMVVAAGVKILSEVDYKNRSNQYIIGFSAVFGMIPTLAPDFYQSAPAFLAPITHSGITSAAVTAFLLNLFFTHLKTRS